MRKDLKLVGALAVAGLVAAAGSAFTATSNLDDEAINVGSVLQAVSGANFTNVIHTYDAASDETSAVSAKAEELLSESEGVVTLSVNNGSAQACTVTQTDVDADGVDDGAGDFSSVSCDITDVANVTSIRFVVNG